MHCRMHELSMPFAKELMKHATLMILVETFPIQ